MGCFSGTSSRAHEQATAEGPREDPIRNVVRASLRKERARRESERSVDLGGASISAEEPADNRNVLGYHDVEFEADIGMLDGRVVSVVSKPSDTVGALRPLISEAASIPLSELTGVCFIYYGQRMDEEKRLSYYSIPWNGTKIDLEQQAKIDQQASASWHRGSVATITEVELNDDTDRSVDGGRQQAELGDTVTLQLMLDDAQLNGLEGTVVAENFSAKSTRKLLVRVASTGELKSVTKEQVKQKLIAL